MRLNKDGTGKTAVGPPSFRELSDIRIHKYGADLPGRQLACVCGGGGGGRGVRACVRTYVCMYLCMCLPASCLRMAV